MEMTITQKIYIGSGEVGMRLIKAIEEAANKDHQGNVSRTLVWTFCKFYGINPRTGEPTKTKMKCKE